MPKFFATDRVQPLDVAIATPCGAIAVVSSQGTKWLTVTHTRAGWVRCVDAQALGVEVAEVLGLAVDARGRLVACDYRLCGVFVLA